MERIRLMSWEIAIYILTFIIVLLGVIFIPSKIYKVIIVILGLLIFLIEINYTLVEKKEKAKLEKRVEAVIQDIQVKEAHRIGIYMKYPAVMIDDPLFRGLFQQGEEYVNKGDYKEAINTYRKILNYHTVTAVNKSAAHNNIGLCYKYQNKPEEALRYFINSETTVKEIDDKKVKLKVQTITFTNIALAYKELYQYNLSLAYFKKLIKINNILNDNLKKAEIFHALADLSLSLNNSIQAYQEALLDYNKDDFPSDYAHIQNNLGVTYRTLAKVQDKAENSQLAISALKEALKVYSLDHLPKDYAETQNNLGVAYSSLAETHDKEKNFQLAINAFNEALKIYSLDYLPKNYAETQNNLGVVYTSLVAVQDRAENFQLAINAFNEALKIYSLDYLPVELANTQVNLGCFYGTLAEVHETAKNCQLAINAFNIALKIFTLDRFPMKHVMIQHNIGLTYLTIAQSQNNTKYCRLALEAFRKVWSIISKEDYPEMCQFIDESTKLLLNICNVKSENDLERLLEK